ncbi:MAG: hypothetical protein ACI4MH_05235 [Candidatus Coproplasma sp.]
MFERSKKIKELSAKVDEVCAPLCDGDGKRVINLNVSDDSDFLSPYSTDGKPLISGEVASFLEHSVKRLKVNEDARLIVHSSCIDDNEKVVYKKAIENYYVTEAAEVKAQLKRNMLLSIIMLFIGAVIFSVAITLEHIGFTLLWLDILDVAAWVFVWESVDLFVLQRPALRTELLMYYKLISAEIIFKDSAVSSIAV